MAIVPRWSYQAPVAYELVKASPEEREAVINWYQQYPVTGYEIRNVETLRHPLLAQIFEARVAYLQANHIHEENPEQNHNPLQNHTLEVLNGLVAAHQNSATPQVSTLPLWHAIERDHLNTVLENGYVGEQRQQHRLGMGYYHTNEARHASRSFENSVLVVNWVAFTSAFPVTQLNMDNLTFNRQRDLNFALTVPHQTDYRPIGNDDFSHLYTEFVLNHPAQILPKYVVELKMTNPERRPIVLNVVHNEWFLRAKELIQQQRYPEVRQTLSDQFLDRLETSFHWPLFELKEILLMLINNNQLPIAQGIAERIHHRSYTGWISHLLIEIYRRQGYLDQAWQEGLRYFESSPCASNWNLLRELDGNIWNQRRDEVHTICNNILQNPPMNRYSLRFDLLPCLVEEGWYEMAFQYLDLIPPTNLESGSTIWNALIANNSQQTYARCIRITEQVIEHNIDSRRYERVIPWLGHAQQAAQQANNQERFRGDINRLLGQYSRFWGLTPILRTFQR